MPFNCGFRTTPCRTSECFSLASLDTATSLPADFEFDREISTIARLEARYLRQQLLGNVKAFPCAICGRTLPVALLVTAHIKTRSECNEADAPQRATV
jgi:hypothetical protein